jgi:hypothetical protein
MMTPRTIPSKDFPGQTLQPGTLYVWQGQPRDVAHAFRGGATGFLRSVCHWQRWTTSMVDGGRHCRDCTAVVAVELRDAMQSSWPDRITPGELRMDRAARLADFADFDR